MSDKSFGDHTNKNIVKNPLLSSAVTGLSIEDLTHKAVLLPVTPCYGQIASSDQQQGSQTTALAHSQHDTPALPSGDAFRNITLTKTPQINVLDSKNNVKLENYRNPESFTQSKASLKTDDDFDVNEYIARLQGTRYVSAPLHSHLKEDQNANLGATEENLEEINLNETQSQEVQQSLTADIAQNFSQLPTMLPHVASAVFSSFTNMLNYKREQIPEQSLREPDQVDNKGAYGKVQVEKPDTAISQIGMESYGVAKEVSPPPKEPPISGIGNFRITTKKKYAQIPGLSSGDVQTGTFNALAPNNLPVGQNIPYGQSIPPVGQRIPPVGQSVPPICQNMPPGQSMPPVGQSMPPVGQSMPSVGQRMPPTGQSIPPISQSIPPIGQRMPPIGHSIPPVGQSMPPVGYSMPPVGQSMPPVGQSMLPVGQSMPPVGQSLLPVGQSMPPVGPSMPPLGQSMPPVGQSMPPVGQSMLPVGQSMPTTAQDIPATGPNMSSVGQSMPPFVKSTLPVSHGIPPIGPPISGMAPIGHKMPPFSQAMPPTSQSIPKIFNPNEFKIDDDLKPIDGSAEAVKSHEANIIAQNIVSSQINIFNPTAESQNVSSAVEIPASGNQPYSYAAKDSQSFFTPIDHKEQNIPTNPPGSATIIPPPPMFSNLPRRDSQPSIGKSILPPSVARRISSNQPIIKPTVSTPSFSENIFVPAPVSDTSNQADSNFATGFSSSAFVPAYLCKPDSTGAPINTPLEQTNAAYGVSPVDIPQTSFFIPTSTEKPVMSTESTLSSKEKHPIGSKVVPSSTSMLPPPIIPTAGFPPSNVSLGLTEPNMTASSFAASNVPPSSTIFTPGSIHVAQNTPTMFPQQNFPPPPTFFNPLQQADSSSAPHPITQMPPMAIEPPKVVAEPPKAAGNVNFRMTKKRPQYYAGPIEGVGSISNNIKPIIAPVISAEVSNVQSALFTPEQPSQPITEQYVASNIEQASVPFDINRPTENVSANTPFDKPQEQYTPFNMNLPESQNYGHEYNTSFDMSRSVTDAYNPPRQESKGFGIIGSLKSKLSSIDINKIQSTVTTFFDPAYNATKVAEPVAKDNLPYEHHQYGYQQQQFEQTPQEQSNFDIFVPNVEQHQYSQYKEVSYNYGNNNQYYQSQESYDTQNQSQNVYSTSSYFTNPNYSTEQVYSSNPLYDNTQASPPNVVSSTYIPEKIDSVGTSKSIDQDMFYNPNVFTQGSIPSSQQLCQKEVKKDNASAADSKNQQNYFTQDLTAPLNVQQQTSSYSQENIDLQNVAATVASENTSENITSFNPNTYKQENSQRPANLEHSFDTSIGLSQPITDNKRDTATNKSLERTHEPMFYNPSTFKEDQSQLLGSHTQQNVAFNVYKTSDSNNDLQLCDSALNTSKYKMSNIQHSPVPQNAPTPPISQTSSFFDMPQTINQPHFSKDNTTEILTHDSKNDAQIEQKHFVEKNLAINKLSEAPTSSIATKSISRLIEEEQTKLKEIEKEHETEKYPIESISRNDIPVLGVSTMPLFGLSTIIADKSKESESENDSAIPYFESSYQPPYFEENTAVNFFENLRPENKLISESQLKEKPLDITALSITDVKNVLIIEPPQENIVALLKRNASSSKLESLQKTEESSDHLKQQTENTASQEKFYIKLDENVSEKLFKNLGTGETEENIQKIAGDQGKDNLELNICETCREVQTPDIAEHAHRSMDLEDLTTQLIENITSRMQLSHPLTVPLTESEVPINETPQYDEQQFEEIAHVAEETIETLNVQSATELLDDEIATSKIRNYGWAENATFLTSTNIDHDYTHIIEPNATISTNLDFGLQMNPSSTVLGSDYELTIDPNSIGFFGDNSLFFDKLPTNASDEIKAEIKHSHDDIVLPRQMSVPSAPPQEEDIKLDEPGVIDVHSIEQDAKKDFPLEEEFIIEPSDDFLSTDDDKIESRERKRSSEDSTSNDTFTNRVERFKKKIDSSTDNLFDQKQQQVYGHAPMSMASYFDTGNYAVESHYKNSLSSPTSINAFQYTGNVLRIPPGFEEEYARRMSGISLSSGENKNEPQIPETSTQTKHVTTVTYSSTHSTDENTSNFEMHRSENADFFLEELSRSQTEKRVSSIVKTTQSMGSPVVTAAPVQTIPALTDTTTTSEFTQNQQPLQDPMNFFSASVELSKSPVSDASESFSRLASYFSMPPAQPEHSKSFFELSQSQNHYRHDSRAQNVTKPFFELSESQNHYIDDDTKNNIKDLMLDLTSPRNIQERVIKTVNYFTVEMDDKIKLNTNAAPINVKISEDTIHLKVDAETKTTNLTENVNDSDDAIFRCKYCLRYLSGIDNKDFKVRTATNEPSEPKKESGNINMRDDKIGTPANINLANFDVEGQSQDGVTVLTENRTSLEYTPVKHHWFYRVDVEEKSVWRGFSLTDSQALENTYHSPTLDENTLVPTDGGRYDVNVKGRLRIAVYWKEKPTNVRRCSWFYKGTTDARYVPYTEPVADKLEEEYRRGITTGEWHRKLPLPNSELVIMHGPSVMVHFLHSTTDAFSSPPSLLGKRVYRNTPNIKVAKDQLPTIDHLVFLVHGAGEYKRGPYVDQTTTRPRIVRRGYEEFEIEDCEPSKIDHLLLLCHGVGSACDMKFRSVEEVVADFRTTTLQLLQSHYKNSYDNGIVSRVEVLPISWHDQLHSGEAGVDRRLSRVTLDSIPRLRAFTNHTVLDVLFYTSPVFHQTIINTVCSELNRVYSVFQERNPLFKGGVSLGGHSLGSVILYDLLCHQIPKSPSLLKSPPEKNYVSGAGAKEQPGLKYPQLVFPPDALYALGSPIAIFECIRGVESLGMDFSFPTCKHFFNIFHPYDPIAYRIEPLINPFLQEVKPSQIPHHKGRKRMHLELKDTMARVGADLKQKLIESVRTTWNKWKASPPPEGQLEKVVEEEIEKEQLRDDDQPAEVQVTPEMLGRLNSGRRIDYVLQEAPLEMINEYLFAMSSHVGYWESEDTMLLMLREIYSALGVQPDSTVPQQSMTVQRTRTVGGYDETSGYNDTDYPSTSRGGT